MRGRPHTSAVPLAKAILCLDSRNATVSQLRNYCEYAMALTLHFHPLSSYCQKVLIALYERGLPFDGRLLDLGDDAARAAFLDSALA